MVDYEYIYICLFGMFHSGTHEKFKWTKWCYKSSFFATIALGMGVNLKDVNIIYHYGAPQSIDDYFQDSGQGGRSGNAVMCDPMDLPL